LKHGIHATRVPAYAALLPLVGSSPFPAFLPVRHHAIPSRVLHLQHLRFFYRCCAYNIVVRAGARHALCACCAADGRLAVYFVPGTVTTACLPAGAAGHIIFSDRLTAYSCIVAANRSFCKSGKTQVKLIKDGVLAYIPVPAKNGDASVRWRSGHSPLWLGSSAFSTSDLWRRGAALRHLSSRGKWRSGVSAIAWLSCAVARRHCATKHARTDQKWRMPPLAKRSRSAGHCLPVNCNAACRNRRAKQPPDERHCCFALLRVYIVLILVSWVCETADADFSRLWTK